MVLAIKSHIVCFPDKKPSFNFIMIFNIILSIMKNLYCWIIAPSYTTNLFSKHYHHRVYKTYYWFYFNSLSSISPIFRHIWMNIYAYIHIGVILFNEPGIKQQTAFWVFFKNHSIRSLSSESNGGHCATNELELHFNHIRRK